MLKTIKKYKKGKEYSEIDQRLLGAPGSRYTHWLLTMLPVLGCIAWYLLKVFQFQTSPEQYPDGMVILQLSRGWLEGRPLLFDTIYGNHALQHNYYFIPLTGIFTKPMGVYGLFMAYVCLVGFFFWNYHQSLLRFKVSERYASWLTALCYVFGPMAYFMYLDYFGWHPEQYLVPLLALLALSLAQRKWGMSLVWLLLALLVKESAIVFICCLLLFCSVVDLVLRDPGKPWLGYLLNKRNVILTGICLALFALGIWWLSHLNGPRTSRLAQAFANVHFNITFFFYVVFSCAVGLLTFGLGLIPFIPWLRTHSRNGLIIWVLGGCYMVLFVMFATESLYYFPTIYPGIAYPPRISGLWAFMFSAFLFLSYRFAQAGISRKQNAISWTLTGCLLQFVIAPFLVAHHFTFETKPARLSADVAYMFKTRLGLDPYPDGLANELHDLAEKLSPGSEVIVPFQHMRYFENVYPSFWGYHAQFPRHILGRPLLYIYEKELVKSGFYRTFPGSDYQVIPNEHLLILADPGWYKLNFK